jgi:hypothetical protein
VEVLTEENTRMKLESLSHCVVMEEPSKVSLRNNVEGTALVRITSGYDFNKHDEIVVVFNVGCLKYINAN